MPNKPLLLLLLLLVHGGLTITTDAHSSLGDVIISDGVDDHIQDHPPLVLPFFATTEESCEPTYGFVPCTTTIIGNIFLIVVYGYFMILAAQYLSTGSETLLKILGPGIVGGFVLPFFDVLPDAMLILVSGLSGSTEYAQYKVSVGMGLIAGTTITLLTIVWGSCVVAGKCDLGDSGSIDNQDTKRFSLTGSGISTDKETRHTAWIMTVSIIPFIIVQISQALHSSTRRHLAVLISFIFSLLLSISYCLYRVFQPWIQERKIAYTKHMHVISELLRYTKMRRLGRLLTDDGEVNREVLERVFTSLDGNNDGKLSDDELKALITGIHFEEIDFNTDNSRIQIEERDLNRDDAVEEMMKEFDMSQNKFIEVDEFFEGIEKWLKGVVKRSVNHGAHSEKLLSDLHVQTKREHDLWGVQFLGGQSYEILEGVKNIWRIKIESVLMLLLGTIIAFVFSNPLVDAVDNLSSATSIPSFSISFIVLPFATNISEWVSTVTTASKKQGRTASLSFSEIYGAVTMNNLLCLSVFSALVYFRGLTWGFSAEVLVIVIVCIVMGAFASFRTTFPLWTSLVAFLVYFSLVLIYILVHV